MPYAIREMIQNETLTPQQSLAANGRSFHWASRFLGARMGDHATRLYAFCRLLDDMADGDIDDGPARLSAIREDMIAGRTGSDPALAAFQPFMKQMNFSAEVLVALIDGLLQDQADEVCLADEAELLRYAYRVAGTVGLLMCDVLDCHDQAAKAHAIDLGIAMQLTNIARDVLEDAQMGRRYVPGIWVENLSADQIVLASKNPDSAEALAMRNAVEKILALAERFYESGARGFRFLPWRAHLAIAVAARVYRQIGVQLAATGYAWHRGRQVTSASTKLRCSLPALFSLLARSFTSPSHRHDATLHRPLEGLPHVS